MDHRDIDGGPGYDADLESRLYAEIHYSNDTYPDRMPAGSLLGNNHNGHVYSSSNPIPNIMNQYPSMSSRYRSHPNAHPRSHQNSWRIDSRPNCEPHNSTMYSRNYQGMGISSNYNNSSYQQPSVNYSRNNEMYSKRPRPLLDSYPYSHSSVPHHYDFTNDPTSFSQLPNDYEHPSIRNRVSPHSSVSPAPLRRNNNIEIMNQERLGRNPSRKVRTPSTDTQKNKFGHARKKNGKKKSSSSNKHTNSQRENAATATNSKNTLDNSVENIRPPGTEETTSKYDVAPKSNQPQEINPSEPSNSVEMPSDSDESIFEVPVPPKPKPLLIDLKDSDEASSSDDDEEQSPVVMSEKSQILQQQQQPEQEQEQEQPSSTLPPLIADENTNSSSVIVPTIISSSESTQDSPDENINPPTINTNTEELSNDIDTISSNIIINCTQVATGVTTLADIKRLRESTNAPPTADGLSEDSMTESEAMKWGQIEGQMGGNNGDKSADNEYNQLPRNSVKSVDKTADETVNAQSTSKSVETVAEVIDKTPSPGRKTTQINAKRKRSQRSESELEVNNELNNSANNIESIRTKRPAREKSFEESLFEPRPKNLERFYNEPRPGIIMLDIHKIQSRMSSDPNRWAILDVDKGNTVNMRDRKKKCSLCHREGHLRDKCPNHRQVPTCHMCGEVGHFEPRCPYSMCLTCGTKFSSYRKTCESCRSIKCRMCKSVGHTNDNCPDLWRRYHQTTPPNASVNSSRETGTHKLSSSENSHIHKEIIPPVNQSESSNLESSERDKSPVDAEIKNESIESLPSSPSSLSSTKILNGHIFFHWKSSNLWPDNLIQNYTRLNDIKDSMIDGLIAGTVFPAFITELDDICPFELIMGYHNGFAQMFLQTYSEEVLDLLKKLIIMWLIRVDDEKWLMIGSATLPINRRKLLNTIKERQVLARSTWSTADQENIYDLLKQIDSRKKIIEDIYKSYPIIRPPDVQLSLEKVETTTNDIKWRVVLCLYYCEWIKGAKEIIDNFHTMIMELERNKHYIEIPVTMYLKILQFCNEVFTPHTSQHIIDGAKRCMESMSKQQIGNKKKISSPLSKNKIIMQTLYKLMFEYELCKRKKTLSNRIVMKKFDDIENLLLKCPENDKYIKSLESYRELLDGDGSIQQLTAILGYFTSLLRKKLGLSEEWRKKTIQKICRDLEEIGHLHKTTGTSVIVPTNPSKILKSLNELACSNCSKVGHHSSNCNRYRWSQHFISPRFVTSYTKGPCYISDDATNEDWDGDTTIDSLNDTINSTIEEIAEISNESSTAVKLLYEYSNVPPDAMKTWPNQIINLSIFKPKHHICQWEKEFIEPTFLRTQFPPAVNCQFSVQIDQLPGLHKYNLILKASSHECLVCLKKLMVQWLDRREVDDQLIMNDSEPLPWTKANLLEFLSKELCQFVSSINARDVNRAIYMLPTNTEIYNSLGKKRERFTTRVHRSKRIAIALAYNRGLIPAKSILGEFKIFMKQLAFLPIADNHPVSPDIYMSAVWFRFELFSPSLSRKILNAICRYDNRYRKKKKGGKSNLNQNEKSETRLELLPEILDEHEVIALFSEIKRAPKINPDPVIELNTSAPVCGNKLDNTIQDIGNGSDYLALLNEQMVSQLTAQTQSEPTEQIQPELIKQTGNGNDKGTPKVAKPKNKKIAAEKPKMKQKKEKYPALELPKALPKPRPKHLENKSDMLNYVYNASVYARQHDLKALIPRIDHMIDRAKLGLVVGEELMGLWARSVAARKMSRDKITNRKKLKQKKSSNPNPRKNSK